MTYKLIFKTEALKEWKNLDDSVRKLFHKKLKERLEQPCIESARLSGMRHCYKIKLRATGYRLVYEVRKLEVVVIVIAVGKRERNQVYKLAVKRI